MKVNILTCSLYIALGKELLCSVFLFVCFGLVFCWFVGVFFVLGSDCLCSLSTLLSTELNYFFKMQLTVSVLETHLLSSLSQLILRILFSSVRSNVNKLKLLNNLLKCRLYYTYYFKSTCFTSHFFLWEADSLWKLHRFHTLYGYNIK